jgi:glutathione S-transferase
VILYDSPLPAPNPRRVRIVAAEKGIALRSEHVSLIALENRGADHLARNPLGQTPVLMLDDGTMLSESVAICRYLDALQPSVPLFGQSALEIGMIDMWLRRVEFGFGVPVRNYWVNYHRLTAHVVPERFKDFGKSNARHAMAAMALFDAALAKGPFIAGAHLSIADIVLLTIIDFADFIGLSMPDSLCNLGRWHTDISARPSASA